MAAKLEAMKLCKVEQEEERHQVEEAGVTGGVGAEKGRGGGS